MRITFLMPASRVSGGSRVVMIYAKKLAVRGHEVRVVWHRLAPLTLRRRIKNVLKRNDREAKARNPYLDGSDVLQVTAPRPGTITNAEVPDGDVVIATWWNTAFEVAALSPAKGAKVYFVQHHEVHEHLPRHITRGSYFLPLKKITISQWLVDVMAQEYGDEDVELVENSVDTDLFRAPIRQKNAVPTVGLLYSPTRFKGVDVSLKAIEHARRLVPDLQVVAFGMKPVDTRLPLPAGTSYFQAPPQEKIREIYAMCDVWLCGSRSEGFHLPPLEAMACRTPVVSTRVGGAMDVVEDGVTGWIVDVEDANALGVRLAEVASLAPGSWREMSEAAYQRAISYTWDDATDRFEAALVRAVESRGRPDATLIA